jgi:hypothetical protein
MPVMAMMVVVVPVVMMTPVMVPMVMPTPMHQLHGPGGSLAACQHLRQSRRWRSLGRRSHHRPGKDDCGG